MEKIEYHLGLNGLSSLIVKTTLVTPQEGKDNKIEEAFVWEYWSDNVEESFLVIRTIYDFLRSAHSNDLFLYKQPHSSTPTVSTESTEGTE